jgi:hypothetical protein
MATKIGDLLVGIGADVTDLLSGTKDAGKALDSLGEKTREFADKMAKAAAAAAVAAGAIAIAFVKSGLDAIDAQAKLARSLDASIDGLRTLQLAANGAGVSNDELSDSVRNLNQRLGDAQRGSGAAYDALTALGLSARALADMDADQRVAAIAARINELGLSSSQAADLLRDLGVKNENMVTLLRGGSAAFAEAAEKLKAYGLSISDISAAKVEAANDALADMGLAFEAVRNAITIELAPVIAALATKFNELAKENGGFGKLAIEVARTMIMAFAKVGDVIQGLAVVFKGIELIATGAEATFRSVAQVVMEVFVAIVEAVDEAIYRVKDLYTNAERAPKLSESGFVKSFRDFAEEARVRVGAVRSEMHDLATKTPPSAQATKFLDDLTAAADKSAAAAANASKAIRDDKGNPNFDPEGVERAKEIEKAMPKLPDSFFTDMLAEDEKKLTAEREALQKRLDTALEFQLTEIGQEKAAQAERLKTLEDAKKAGLLLEDNYNYQVQAAEQAHADKIKTIREKSMTDLEKFSQASFGAQVKTAVGALQDITAGISKESKAAFEINKIAGQANVALKIPEAVQNAYTWGNAFGGPPAGAAAAAIAFAASVANLQAITKQRFGSGSAPSLGGSTSAPPVSPVSSGTASRGQGQVVSIEGLSPEDLITGKMARALFAQLQDVYRDGGVAQFV